MEQDLHVTEIIAYETYPYLVRALPRQSKARRRHQMYLLVSNAIRFRTHHQEKS